MYMHVFYIIVHIHSEGSRRTEGLRYLLSKQLVLPQAEVNGTDASKAEWQILCGNVVAYRASVLSGICRRSK